MALAGVTDQIENQQERDVVDVQLGKHWINGLHPDGSLKTVLREVKTVHAHSGAAELGPYRHYMQKEIFEQPRAVADTLEGVESIVPELVGDGARMQAGLHHARWGRDRWRIDQGVYNAAGGLVPVDARTGAGEGAIDR